MPLTDAERQKLQTLIGGGQEDGDFDLASAHPVQQDDGEFDLASARPVIESSPDATHGGIFGNISESQYQAGERNLAGNLFERPAASMRGFIQGMAPGGPNPVEGYVRGSINPGTIPTFQQLVEDQYARGTRSFQTTPLTTPIDFAGRMGTSLVGMAADVATSPADMAMVLAGKLPGVQRAIGAVAKSPIGRRVGQIMTSNFRWPSLRSKSLTTVAEVLQVPEARLPALTVKERTTYFQARAQQIKQQTMQITQQLNQEKVLLQKELGKKATERALELREQVPTLLSKQSSHYRTLADAELAPLANEAVEIKKLAAYVHYRFGKDPEALAEVSGRLGLTNEALEKITVSPLLDDLGRTIQQTTLTTRKLGELYQQAKDMGQQLPSSVRESLRVYNRDEHFIDDSIDTLMGFLKENGVNLKAANEHWRGWAPVRNQLVRETRPYNLAGTQTASFSQRLIKLAKGIDPDNALYAKTVAEGLGVSDLPGELKAVTAKLDTNQKARLALTLQQQESLGQLQALRFKVGQMADRSAKQMAAVKWIIGLLGGGLLWEGGKKLTGGN